MLNAGENARATVVDAAAAAVVVGTEPPRVLELLQLWRDGEGDGSWTRAFARPRLKLPDIRDYLSANRSVQAAAWLRLQREEHHRATPQQRRTGVMGSALGSDWGFDDVPTATQAPGEHIVAVEHYSPSTELLLETRDGPQNPVGIAIATGKFCKGRAAAGYLFSSV